MPRSSVYVIGRLTSRLRLHQRRDSATRFSGNTTNAPLQGSNPDRRARLTQNPFGGSDLLKERFRANPRKCSY
jgi:hypothetical protein